MPRVAHSSEAKAAKKQRLKENFIFLGKFLRHGTTIASVWPSSKHLARATISEINWDTARVIVELGAGTGPITDQVIKRLKPHTHFLAIERDADLFRLLAKRFENLKNVEVVKADVRDLETVLKSRGIKHVDAFISGLPTPSLPASVRRRMLVSVRRYLAPGGVYSNITEIPYIYWNYYKSVFRDVSFDFVVRNMPPGGVYHCRAMK